MRSVKRDIFATRKGKAESSTLKAFYFLTQMNLRWREREFAPFKMDRRWIWIYSEDFGVGNYNNIFMFEKRF